MTADEALDQHRRFLSEIGEDIVIQGKRGGSLKMAAVRGRPLGNAASAIAGANVQGTSRLIVINDPAATVPEGCVRLSELLPLLPEHDVAVVGGRQLRIQSADDRTRRIAGVIIAIELTVAG